MEKGLLLAQCAGHARFATVPGQLWPSRPHRSTEMTCPRALDNAPQAHLAHSVQAANFRSTSIGSVAGHGVR